MMSLRADPFQWEIGASITRIPVCNGCLTGCRCTTVGATFSIVRKSRRCNLAFCRSMGWPSGIDDPAEHRVARPARRRCGPFRRTVSPSLISESEPMINDADNCPLREFSATPCSPLANSTSSEERNPAPIP